MQWTIRLQLTLRDLMMPSCLLLFWGSAWQLIEVSRNRLNVLLRKVVRDIRHLRALPVSALKHLNLHFDVLLILAREIRNCRRFPGSVRAVATYACLHARIAVPNESHFCAVRHKLGRGGSPRDRRSPDAGVILRHTFHLGRRQAFRDRLHHRVLALARRKVLQLVCEIMSGLSHKCGKGPASVRSAVKSMTTGTRDRALCRAVGHNPRSDLGMVGNSGERRQVSGKDRPKDRKQQSEWP